jgi:RNA-dependent RNA polymerase
MADPDCIKLSKLHSIAVDFPKTGRFVQYNKLPRSKAKMKPDWYANETHEGSLEFYPSNRILGHLFRAIQLPADPEAKHMAIHQTKLLYSKNGGLDTEVVQNSLTDNDSDITKGLRCWIQDVGLDVELFVIGKLTKVINEMCSLYQTYSRELSYLCSIHSLSTKIPLTEEEVVTGTIVARCSQPVCRLLFWIFTDANECWQRMRQDVIAAMRRSSTSLCAITREGIEGSGDIAIEDVVERAWTAWKVAVAVGGSFGAKSFALLALDVMFSCLRKMEQGSK